MTTSSRSTANPWVVWVVGLLVYVLAVFHRSSLGVAGLVAAERFDISATQLATFTMLQLLVYAGMQIPVGLLVDRFGPRSVLLVGLVLMTLAQGSFAFADSYSTALVARAFVGIGDAMTFICVLRLVNSWFPLRRIPFVTQITGTLGQLGAVAAAVPMTWALAHLGLDPGLPGRGLDRGRPDGRRAGAPQGCAGRAARPGCPAVLRHRAREPGRLLGATGHPARASGCTSPRSSARPR